MRDHPQLSSPITSTAALVFGQRIVEGDFFLATGLFLAARPGRPDVLGKLDQLLDHLRRGDGVRVIAGDRLFRAAREKARVSTTLVLLRDDARR